MGNTIKVNTELLSRARDIKEKGRNATREERMQLLRDIELEREALKNGWSDDEKLNNRVTVEQNIEVTRRILEEETHLEVECLLNEGKNLSEFDRSRAKKLVKENPETAEIMEQVFNEII